MYTHGFSEDVGGPSRKHSVAPAHKFISRGVLKRG